MLSSLLFLVGVVFGRAWFGFILLPLVYGIPRAAAGVFRGELKASAVVYYLFWAGLASIVLLAVVFAVLFVSRPTAEFLRDSPPFSFGQLVGVAFGVMQMLSAGGRADLEADFSGAMAHFRYGRNPGGKTFDGSPNEPGVYGYFLAAATSYFIFNDMAARRAAVLATAVADVPNRVRILSTLAALADPPEAVVVLFASACVDPNCDVRQISPRELATRIQNNLNHLNRDIVRFDGDAVALRRRLREKAPEYEHGLADLERPNPAVFSRLDPGALSRIERLYS